MNPLRIGMVWSTLRSGHRREATRRLSRGRLTISPQVQATARTPKHKRRGARQLWSAANVPEWRPDDLEFRCPALTDNSTGQALITPKAD
jgi:hypothetical protein